MNFYYEDDKLIRIEESETNSYFVNGKPTDKNPANDVKNDGEVKSKRTMTLLEFINFLKESHAQKCLKIEEWYLVVFDGGKLIHRQATEAKTKGELSRLLEDVIKIICNIEDNKDNLYQSAAFAINNGSKISPVFYEKIIKQANNLKQFIELRMQNIEIDIEKLIKYFIFKYRDKVRIIIEEFNNSKLDPQKIKGKEFTAIASIFYDMVELEKDKKPVRFISGKIKFTDWLRIFSEAYHRKKPSYKKTQVTKSIESIKCKLPFLDNPPVK